MPKKRNRGGKKFGFTRFGKREDAIKAVERTNGVWLEDFKLGVNIAKFDRSEETETGRHEWKKEHDGK